jgi:hypothetical protein
MKDYYKGYVVPCIPEKEWGEWMSNTHEACPTGSKMNCVGVRCDDCIYSINNADVRKEFYEHWYGKWKEEELPELSEKVSHCPDCPVKAEYLFSDEEGNVWALKSPTWVFGSRLRSCDMVKLEIRCKPLSIIKREHKEAPKEKPSCENCANYEPKEKPTKPKLTQAIFDSEDCPAWAKWAAVDEDGRAAWYSERPEIDRFAWFLKDKSDRFEWIKTPSHLAFRYYDSSEWMLSLIERPGRLPKLTQAVFDREDCPEWANWAAVDADGRAFWYEVKPDRMVRAYVTEDYKGELITKPGRFDASDWEHSLIERPKKPSCEDCKNFEPKQEKAGTIEVSMLNWPTGWKYSASEDHYYHKYDQRHAQWINFATDMSMVTGGTHTRVPSDVLDMPCPLK